MQPLTILSLANSRSAPDMGLPNQSLPHADGPALQRIQTIDIIRGVALLGILMMNMLTPICTGIFFGYGLGYFGQLQYYQLFYIVGGIWLFQLIVSSVWLHYFRFGPLEWLWRSLTYWKRQPMRLVTVESAP